MRKFLLILCMVYGVKARRIIRQAVTIAHDDIVFIGNSNARSYSSHFIHDIFDESMFYEFLQSNRAVTKRNLEAYINMTIGNFGNLSDQQFDMIISKWIFQMLP